VFVIFPHRIVLLSQTNSGLSTKMVSADGNALRSLCFWRMRFCGSLPGYEILHTHHVYFFPEGVCWVDKSSMQCSDRYFFYYYFFPPLSTKSSFTGIALHRGSDRHSPAGLPTAWTLWSFPCGFSERSLFFSWAVNPFGQLLSKMVLFPCKCLKNPQGKYTDIFGVLLVPGSTARRWQTSLLSGLGLS